MNVLREIAEQVRDGENGRVRYTVSDGGGGYFQNVRRILEFSPDRILLGGKKGKLRIEGEELSLGKCFKGDVAVRGRILRVGREE